MPDDPTLNDGVACDDYGCTAWDQSGNRVALAHHAGALAEDCRQARVVISTVAGASECQGEVRTIDARDLGRYGAHALYRDVRSLGDYRVETTYPAIRRPFMPPAGQ